MTWITQSEINQRDSEQARERKDVELMRKYPDCPCCESDDGMTESGVPCGYCRKGIALDKEE